MKAVWTTEEDQVVIRMLKEGKTLKEISATLGTKSPKQVGLRRWALGVTAKKTKFDWTAERLRLLGQRYDEGKSYAAIGKELGCSRDIVRWKVKNLGFPSRPKSSGVRNKLTKVLEDEIAKRVDPDLPDETRNDYWRAHSQACTIEMVIYSLWKTHPRNRIISIENAAIKLIRLIGHGDRYFWDRRDWTIETWIKHLAKLTEEDMP